MKVDTKELRVLEAKATEGPWHTKTECPGRCCWHVFKHLPLYGGVPDEEDGTQDSPVVMGECSEEDALFMATARNSIIALLDQLDAQSATLANIETFVACDASAISYLSLGEYRTALLKMLRQAPAITTEKE
ncbi:MAG TPA: hypothetical protein DEO64_16045 [Alcaligenes faecalis]|nr:hypothetical protein [Alcaligenes faecalis]